MRCENGSFGHAMVPSGLPRESTKRSSFETATEAGTWKKGVLGAARNVRDETTPCDARSRRNGYEVATRLGANYIRNCLAAARSGRGGLSLSATGLCGKRNLLPKRHGPAISENNRRGKMRPRSRIAPPATDLSPPRGTGKSFSPTSRLPLHTTESKTRKHHERQQRPQTDSSATRRSQSAASVAAGAASL